MAAAMFSIFFLRDHVRIPSSLGDTQLDQNFVSLLGDL